MIRGLPSGLVASTAIDFPRFIEIVSNWFSNIRDVEPAASESIDVATSTSIDGGLYAFSERVGSMMWHARAPCLGGSTIMDGGWYLRQTKRGRLRIDRAAVKEAARYDGKWVITSNDDTLTAEDLALGY